MTTKQTVQAPIIRYPFHFHHRGEQPKTNDDADHDALPSRVPVQGLDSNDLQVLTQKLSSLETDLEQSISTLEKSKSKMMRKTFDDSSTCCSTTCMEDSLSSLKASSHNQLLGMTLEPPPYQNHQDRQQRDQRKVEGDAVEEGRDINNGDVNLDGDEDGDESPHHEDDESLNENNSGSLEESSSSLTSLSLYSLRRSASFVKMNTIRNNGKDRFHHSFDTSALSVGTYRRRRERRYRKIRNSLEATSMDIRSLPRELELEEQEKSHSDLQQET
eukprot:CAMPEP_0113484620 /NCGR_PEP_ID=MMETSP0014_2-20120614/24056_1 /TAXON_ID=2857 /ORGANISM="Nitzschia sp." /LENGTH=272 /DNA_ID=CAMNT_0000378229 /DNA_START=831 /DNA_END=1649 /DNA_ORIENTATION=+ /assembly_acc=CAM_ASM_000159